MYQRQRWLQQLEQQKLSARRQFFKPKIRFKLGGHKGGGTDRGGGCWKKFDESNIQYYKFKKYDYFVYECFARKKNQEDDTKLTKQDDEYVFLMVKIKEEGKYRDQ